MYNMYIQSQHKFDKQPRGIHIIYIGVPASLLLSVRFYPLQIVLFKV